MSPLIRLYVSLIALVVIAIITTAVLYRSRRRGIELAGQPISHRRSPKISCHHRGETHTHHLSGRRSWSRPDHTVRAVALDEWPSTPGDQPRTDAALLAVDRPIVLLSRRG
jgi:hypothetical protein